jgi:drug/metabolite transporter (DMT)-like permease
MDYFLIPQPPIFSMCVAKNPDTRREFWVWLFVDEVLSRWTLIGGSIIIAAVAVRAILEPINKSRPEQTPGQPA